MQVQIRASVQRLGRSLHPARCPVLFALTILCLVARENYPFSNFPMYSSFAKTSYYIYLANGAGQPLATSRFGVTTTGLKKIFESNRRAEFRVGNGVAKPDSALADRAAAAALLCYLDQLPDVRRQPPELLHGLQVRRVNLLWKAGRIESETTTIAHHP